MERKTSFAENQFYHIYNRGVDKREIFSNLADYRRFTMLLYLANSDRTIHIADILKSVTYSNVFSYERGEQLVAIGAYCLMPNHFHLLLTPSVENGVSKFMLKLQTGYAMYFNVKNSRSGSLFQGTFKSQHIDDDRYLQYLYSYIHLNPAKLKDSQWRSHVQGNAELVRFVEQYPYSSYDSYIRNSHAITDPTHYPDYFTSREDVRTHITTWLAEDDTTTSLRG